jgi:hypothetical protein
MFKPAATVFHEHVHKKGFDDICNYLSTTPPKKDQPWA